MTDLSKHEVNELRKLIADKRESLRAIRFSSAGSRSRDTSETKKLKRDIARCLTELRNRSLSGTTR